MRLFGCAKHGYWPGHDWTGSDWPVPGWTVPGWLVICRESLNRGEGSRTSSVAYSVASGRLVPSCSFFWSSPPKPIGSGGDEGGPTGSDTTQIGKYEHQEHQTHTDGQGDSDGLVRCPEA